MRLATDNGKGTSQGQSCGPRGSQPGLVGIPGLLLSGCVASGKAPSLCVLARSSVGVVMGMEWAGGRDAARGSICAGFTAEEPGAQGEEWSVGAPSSCLLQSHAGALPLGPVWKGPFCRRFQALGEEARSAAAWAVEVGNVRFAPPGTLWKVTSEQLLHCGTPSAPWGRP